MYLVSFHCQRNNKISFIYGICSLVRIWYLLYRASHVSIIKLTWMLYFGIFSIFLVFSSFCQDLFNFHIFPDIIRLSQAVSAAGAGADWVDTRQLVKGCCCWTRVGRTLATGHCALVPGLETRSPTHARDPEDTGAGSYILLLVIC